jgi:hypothetical protein
VTFGPLVEVPLANRSTISVQGGVSFRPYDSPRFHLLVNVGLWKPSTAQVGMKAGR